LARCRPAAGSLWAFAGTELKHGTAAASAPPARSRRDSAAFVGDFD
jgi:hypothetical protein